jgi:hypothetical protein
MLLLFEVLMVCVVLVVRVRVVMVLVYVAQVLVLGIRAWLPMMLREVAAVHVSLTGGVVAKGVHGVGVVRRVGVRAYGVRGDGSVRGAAILRETPLVRVHDASASALDRGALPVCV